MENRMEILEKKVKIVLPGDGLRELGKNLALGECAAY